MMKKLSLFVLVSALAFSVLAQGKESKEELFRKIAQLTQKKKPEDTEKAYQLSKEFLTRFGQENDEKTKKIRDFAQKYRLARFNELLDQLKIQEALSYAKDILADDPEDPYVMMNLAYAGFDLFIRKQDQSFSAEALSYAKQTLSLFEKGKLPKEYAPFKDRDEAEALMYYITATFMIESDLKEAAHNFYRSIQFNSQIKKKAYPYYVIAFYYEKAYEKAANDFRRKHGNKLTEDTEMLKDNEQINKIIDRMMDARAVKIGEAENNSSTEEWKKRLKEIYVFRNKSDKGLDEFLANVLSKEMPDPTSL